MGRFQGWQGTGVHSDPRKLKCAAVVSHLDQAAQRKGIRSQVPGSQVIDFACDLVNMNTGHQGGGHARKGYTREAALQVPSLVQGMANAEVAGLRDALEMAFDIADAQIDTNPASISLRALDNDIAAAKASLAKAKQEDERLQQEAKSLNWRSRLWARPRGAGTSAWFCCARPL